MEVEIDEGFIITLENGKDYLLIQRFGNKFFAVELLDEETPSNKYYVLESFLDAQGDTSVEMVEEL